MFITQTSDFRSVIWKIEQHICQSKKVTNSTPHLPPKYSMLKHFDVIQKVVPSKHHFNNKNHYKWKNAVLKQKILGKVRKFERHSSFGVGVITILPEGGFEKPPPPSLNRVKDLIVKEQFIDSCPKYLAIHLRERAPEIDDQYLEAHGKHLFSPASRKPIALPERDEGQNTQINSTALHCFKCNTRGYKSH